MFFLPNISWIKNLYHTENQANVDKNFSKYRYDSNFTPF